jgi:hypothetical protein
MVWGMRLPDSFGEFWPEGDFEYDPKAKESGWRDRLRLHYLAQSPEEQIRLYDYRGFDHGGNGVAYGAANYPSYVSGKFRCEVGTNDGPDSLPFVLAEIHEAPQTFNTEKSYMSLGSMIKMNDRILAVSADFKVIIEKIEPNTHIFFPIEIRMPKGVNLQNDYFTLIINQYFDSYMPEMSDDSKKNMAGRCFSREVTGRAHLWRDRRFPLVTCFSDVLKGECDKAGLRLPKHYKMKEV